MITAFGIRSRKEFFPYLVFLIKDATPNTPPVNYQPGPTGTGPAGGDGQLCLGVNGGTAHSPAASAISTRKYLPKKQNLL